MGPGFIFTARGAPEGFIGRVVTLEAEPLQAAGRGGGQGGRRSRLKNIHRDLRGGQSHLM